jgi:hypothetical protein
MLVKLIALVLLATTSTPAAVPAISMKQTQPPTENSAKCEGRTFASAEEALQSGCCSWHGGVCGCSNGRKVCCDGELSPSCKC